MTMLIAGHETTAAVLTWSIFLLAQVCICCYRIQWLIMQMETLIQIYIYD
jgi:hypothetical protein